MLCRATEETSVLTGKTEILWTAVKAAELVSAGLAAATLTMHGREKENWERETARVRVDGVEMSNRDGRYTEQRHANNIDNWSPSDNMTAECLLHAQTRNHQRLHDQHNETITEITVSHYHIASNYIAFTLVSRRRHVSSVFRGIS